MLSDDRFSILFNSPYQGGFGCVLFDLQESESGEFRPVPTRGWASVNGGQAFRINGPQDLDTDIRWICNLNKSDFWAGGLVRMQKLRHSHYFRTDMGFLMKETGFVPQKVTAPVSCEMLSEVYSRTLKLGMDHYSLSDLRAGEFHEELGAVLFGRDASISNEIDEALLRSYQDVARCPAAQRDGLREAVLRMPRVSHAQAMMATKIPSGAWRLMDLDGQPSEAKLSWALSNELPIVAKVALRGLNERIPAWVSALLEQGEVLGEGGRKKDRDWMTGVELRCCARFAKVEIKAAFECSGWEDAPGAAEILDEGPLSDLSVSLGLLAEAHWMSAAARSRHPQTGSKTLITPRAAWIKAADKAACLIRAVHLGNAGFSVVSYGNGTVAVRAAAADFDKLRTLASKLGLQSPMG